MPIHKDSVLEIIIRQLAFFGFNHITLAVNNRADLFKALFSEQKKYGVKIDFSLETKELATIGPLKIIKNLPENFLVINGDILTDLNFKHFFNYHIKKNINLTLCSHPIISKVDYGVLETDKKNKLTNFKEKPTRRMAMQIENIPANETEVNFIGIKLGDVTCEERL